MPLEKKKKINYYKKFKRVEMTFKIVDGNKIAKKLNQESKEEFDILYNQNRLKPRITTIKIGNNPSSNLYLKLRDKLCNEIGIISDHFEFKDDISEKKIINSIRSLNSDDKVHGIFIQLPLPNHISENNLYKEISPKKDVEGLNPYNMGRTIIGDESIIPCTPKAVLKILDHEKENVKGKDIVIINHSNIVGKPLSILLLNRNATTTVCHVYTKDLIKYTSKADILITAIGLPNIIKKEHVKNNSFVIDVGISKTENGITGDVDFESVKDKVSKITPVPGGVGPITISCSIKNMLKTFQKSIES
jgi:methylenetetrahydrofolate dehydrogenase (NADP+)/methenyltetrahydrofolate cyclohydrolase